MDSKKITHKKIIIRKIVKKLVGEIQCYASWGPVYWGVDEAEEIWEKWELWGEWYQVPDKKTKIKKD